VIRRYRDEMRARPSLLAILCFGCAAAVEPAVEPALLDHPCLRGLVVTTVPALVFGETDLSAIEYHRFDSEDGLVVRFARERYEHPGGRTARYMLRRFAIDGGETSICVQDAASLEYFNTHHNWLDRITATAPMTRYEVALPMLDADTATLTIDGEASRTLTPIETTVVTTTASYECPGWVQRLFWSNGAPCE
jgi:hypothetical protein